MGRQGLIRDCSGISTSDPVGQLSADQKSEARLGFSLDLFSPVLASGPWLER